MTCPPLTITFLGTGTSSGIPMIGCHCAVCLSSDKKDNRLRASILVQSATTSIVIDTGPDFRYQMLREKVGQLDAVLFTHPHKDHIAGLDDVRAFNFFTQKPMDIYCNMLTEEAIRREYYYAFADKKYPGLPQLSLHAITSDIFQIGDIFILPIKTWHHQMPVLAFRFGYFTYITDANKIDEAEKEKIKGSEILVLNALRKEKHLSHFNLEEAIALVNELEIPAAYFTHLSHQMGLHQQVQETLPPTINLAFDQLKISITNIR